MLYFELLNAGKRIVLPAKCPRIFMDVTKNTRSAVYVVNLAALIAFAALLIWSLVYRSEMSRLFANVSYYLTFILVTVWAVHAVLFGKATGFSPVRLLKSYWLGILIAFGLTCVVFLSVKVGFKTLSDETNLVSVARSMLDDKTAYNTTTAKYYYGNIQPINRDIPKRPLVFPFLVYIIHAVTGFRYQNAFALNFIVLFMLLAGIFILTRKRLDFASALAASLLVLSYPVVSVFATSAGFDLLSSAFFILVLAVVYGFIRNPSSAWFSFLIACLLFFGNIRYESILFLAIIPLMLLPKIKWQYVKDSSHLLCLVPLLNLPFIWERILQPKGQFESFQNVQLFSLSSLVVNLKSFVGNLLDFEYRLPYAGIVTIVSALIFLYLIVQIVRRKISLQNYQRYFMLVLLVCVGVSTVMFFAHFFGRYTHPSSARFFITISLFFAFGPVALRILKPDMISARSLLLFAVVCFFFYHPIAVEGRFINTLTLNRTTEHCIRFLDKTDDQNILVVSSRPGQYVAIGYGAIDFSYANKNKANLLTELKRHLYSRMIVFQDIEYKTDLPTADSVLDGEYKLNTLAEIQTTATEFLRISEVKSADKPAQ
jgi:hypothetical protein